MRSRCFRGKALVVAAALFVVGTSWSCRRARRVSTERMSGTELLLAIDTLVRDAREAVLSRELMAGNIPSFLRTLRTVRDSAMGSDGRMHVIEYDVMPDYLAIGTDRDFVRMPMTPRTAQTFAETNGFVLPTRRMVNAIWRAADEQLEPQPMTVAREASATFHAHHRLIETQRDSVRRAPQPRQGGAVLVAGIKKDIVVSNRLLERPNRVAIYGWHYRSGTPIQPLYVGHVDWYVDYSHGVRLVNRQMRVDGVVMPFERIAGDPVLHVLVSDEGPLTVVRYRNP